MENKTAITVDHQALTGLTTRCMMSPFASIISGLGILDPISFCLLAPRSLVLYITPCLYVQ